MSKEKLAPTATLHGYDRWASSYDHIDNPLVAATAWVMDRVPLGCAGCDVVELGCGTGRNAARILAEHARSYTGVDGSRGMLEIAARRTGVAAGWIEADLHAPWTADRTFDLAFVVLVLEHLRELDTLAGTLASCVRGGGRVRIIDLHPDRIAQGSVAHFQDGDRDVVFPSIGHPVFAIRSALERAGFEVETRAWTVDADLLAAVPRVAKHAGLPLVLDVSARMK
jgi:SAM-dependent methyltransferase